MDKTHRQQEQQLIRDALSAAAALGLEGEVLERGKRVGDHEIDGVIGLTHGGRQVRYPVEVKPSVTPANIGPIVHALLDHPGKPLLITTYVSPPMADMLREQGVDFLDAAGNASLSGKSLLVWVKGQKRVDQRAPPASGRAFQPGGLRVVFALLAHPAAVNRPFRDIARMAGVAHGTVAMVIADLEALGHVRDLAGKRGTRRLLKAKDLMRQWTEAYARTLRPKTLLGRYYAPDDAAWERWKLEESQALWGEEPAAALLTRHLRPGALTLYAAQPPALLIARHKLLGQAGPGHTLQVELRDRFWDFPGEPKFPTTVPPLLVYADLLATGEARCLETASRLYEEYLARSFDA